MIRKIVEGLRVQYTDEILARIRAHNSEFDGVGTIVGIEYLNPTPNAMRRDGEPARRETLARVKWDKPIIGNVESGSAHYETVESRANLRRV